MSSNQVKKIPRQNKTTNRFKNNQECSDQKGQDKKECNQNESIKQIQSEENQQHLQSDNGVDAYPYFQQNSVETGIDNLNDCYFNCNSYEFH